VVTLVRPPTPARGFTLIELIVVITLIGLLLTLAVPRYFASIDRGKRTVQLQNLQTIRDAIDKFYGDRSRYPQSLDELVSARYLRALPIDPLTEKSDWILLPPPEHTAPVVPDAALLAQSTDTGMAGTVYDVKSRAAVTPSTASTP
jgi:general secretion pathway protein G